MSDIQSCAPAERQVPAAGLRHVDDGRTDVDEPDVHHVGGADKLGFDLHLPACSCGTQSILLLPSFGRAFNLEI